MKSHTYDSESRDTVFLRMDPVFIIGYSRSGTSVLRLMLNRHPDLFIPRESEYFQKIPPLFKKNKYGIQDIDYILSHLPKDTYEGILDRKLFRQLLQAHLPGGNSILLACLYQACAPSVGKKNKRWGDKKPQHWQFVYKLREWYPESQFVHLVRDPRDSIASMITSLSDNIPLRQIFPNHIILAWQWRYSIEVLQKQGKVLGNKRYLLLKYEDLVQKPTEKLENICNFLRLELSIVSSLLDFQEDANNTKIADGGAHMEATKKPLSSQSIGKYESILNNQQVREIEYICSPIMALFGYQEAGNQPSILERLKIHFICFLLKNIWVLVRFQRRLSGGL